MLSIKGVGGIILIDDHILTTVISFIALFIAIEIYADVDDDLWQNFPTTTYIFL